MSKTQAKTKVIESKDAESYLAKKNRPTVEPIKAPTKKLLINVSAVDKEGNDTSMHIGKFHVLDTDLYSKTIKFRPLGAYNKLIKLSKGKDSDGKEKWNYINESIFFTNYSDPIYDAKGGMACGKIFGTARKALSPAESKANDEKAKSFLYLFGLATFPDSDEEQFVDFRVGGKRIVAASDAFGSKTLPKGKTMSQFIFDFILKPTTKGVHPDLIIEVNAEDIQPITEDIIKHDGLVEEYIEASNARIMSAYKRYAAQATVGVDNDLNDDIDIGEDE